MPLKRKGTGKKKKSARRSHQPEPPSSSPPSSRAISPTPGSPPANPEPAQTFQPYEMTPTKESFDASLQRALVETHSVLAPLEELIHASGPIGPLELASPEQETSNGVSISDGAPNSPPAKPEFSQAYYMAMALLPFDLKKYIEEVSAPDVDGLLDDDGSFHPSRLETDQPPQYLMRQISRSSPTVQQAFVTAYHEKMRKEAGPAYDLMGDVVGEMGGMGAMGMRPDMGLRAAMGGPKHMLGGVPKRAMSHNHSDSCCSGHPAFGLPTSPAPSYRASAIDDNHSNQLGVDLGGPNFGSGLLPPPHMLFPTGSMPPGDEGEDEEARLAAISERKKKKNGKSKERARMKRIEAKQAGRVAGDEAEKASEEGEPQEASQGNNSSTAPLQESPTSSNAVFVSPSSAPEELIVTPLVRDTGHGITQVQPKDTGNEIMEEVNSGGTMKVPDMEVTAEPVSIDPKGTDTGLFRFGAHQRLTIAASESAATYALPPASPEILVSRRQGTMAGRSRTFASLDKMPDVVPVAAPQDEPLPRRTTPEPTRPSLPARRSSGTMAGRSLTFTPVEETPEPLEIAGERDGERADEVRVKDQVGYDDLWEEDDDSSDDVETSLAATAPLTVITEEEEALEEGEVREETGPKAGALDVIPEASRENSVTPLAGVKANAEAKIPEPPEKASLGVSNGTTISANMSLEPPSTVGSPVPSDTTEVDDQPTTIYRIPSELSGRRNSEPFVSPLPTPDMERSHSWGPLKPVFRVQGRPEIAPPSPRQDKPLPRPGVLERTMSTPTGFGHDSRPTGFGERMVGAPGLRRNNSTGLGGWSRTNSANTSPDRFRRSGDMGSFGRPQGSLVYTDISPGNRSPLLPDQQLPSDPSTARPDMNVHPLDRLWTLYFSDSSEKAQSQQSAREYDSGLVKVFHAACIEDLFGSWKALRRAIANSKGREIEPEGRPLEGGGGLGMWLMGDDTNFHLFADGTKPMWEDPMCAKGGKLMMAGDAKKMDDVFLELCLLLVGGNLEVDTPPLTKPSVCGAIISRRKTTTRIEVWLGGRDVPDKRWVNDVHDKLSNWFPQIRVLPYKSFHRN
ncbi:hypothetical protein L202_01459 [Cryptococcus amylolentus CBS 6039]|uniref:Uncharacterized protein n=2 Tax=Cryptococcus amylolentus TaxID=104669 RepID=A0A1E3I424_9TREE|nr:hypothetical protein L202_01459 [Cryptococcus amylolentus CBS 6039]ODN83288.1 hypothetical protein L202_01459 [Cryptococcus amylolentus CBS 6039]ODO10845.1 hypothetical protein I350_01444 [Cryptococcus amylolentus CBS 6273]